MRLNLGSVPLAAGRLFLSGLAVAFSCSCRTATIPEKNEAVAASSPDAETKLVRLGETTRWIKVLKNEMDSNAMVRGREGPLPVDRDPWAQIPLPPGTVATVFGQVVDEHDGHFEMFTQRFVDDSFHGLEFPRPPQNLVRAYQGGVSRLSFDYFPYTAESSLAGTRLRAGTVSKKSRTAPVAASPVETQIVQLLEEKGAVVFCLSKEPAGDIFQWFGDIIAIIEPVATFRTNARNQVLWLTPENFVSYREYRTNKSVENLVSEIRRDGSGYNWRIWERQGSSPMDSGPVERLLYALNTVDWIKIADPLPSDAVLFTRRVIEYRDGNSIRQFVWMDYLGQYRQTIPIHTSGPGKGIIEHAEFGRMEGEYPALIWGVLRELFDGNAK